MRVALIALDAGAAMDPRAVDGGASLHVLQGHLRVHTEGQVREIQTGELVVLSRNLREPVAAVERSAVLAMVGWPNGAGAWRMETTSDRL
jgi:quercetin dioxygenase-like cupin family protein